MTSNGTSETAETAGADAGPRRVWWAWPLAGTVIMALYGVGIYYSDHHVGTPCAREGGGMGFIMLAYLLGAIGLAVLGAEWSIAMLPRVPRRWIGDVTRTAVLVALLLVPAHQIWGFAGC